MAPGLSTISSMDISPVFCPLILLQVVVMKGFFLCTYQAMEKKFGFSVLPSAVQIVGIYEQAGIRKTIVVG